MYTGAIIVSTPQDLALKDAVRGVNMFKKVKIPVGSASSPLYVNFFPMSFWFSRLVAHNISQFIRNNPTNLDHTQIIGMIQNMSTFTCPTCHTKIDIFGGRGGGSVGSAGGIGVSEDDDGHGRGSHGDWSQKCKDIGLSLIGNVPLDARICADADRGRPTVVAEGGSDGGGGIGSERKKAFDGIAERVRQFLAV